MMYGNWNPFCHCKQSTNQTQNDFQIEKRKNNNKNGTKHNPNALQTLHICKWVRFPFTCSSHRWTLSDNKQALYRKMFVQMNAMIFPIHTLLDDVFACNLTMSYGAIIRMEEEKRNIPWNWTMDFQLAAQSVRENIEWNICRCCYAYKQIDIIINTNVV